MRASKLYWIAQVLGWISYISLVTVSVLTNNPADLDLQFLLSIISIILFGIGVTHIQRYLFIKMGWLDLRLFPLIPRLLVSSFLSATVMTALLMGVDQLINMGAGVEKIEFSRVLINIISLWILVMFWNAIYFTYHFFQKSRNQEITNLELEASKTESELKNLRSQLNPHFLFNSLNSIRALVDLDPVKAKKSITTLSTLLRQSLVFGKENLVPLEQEISLAKSYLELEKIRFEERLDVKWNVDNQFSNFQVPPFTLQMLVENAIKHGISNLKEGGEVVISVYMEGENVIVEVVNSGNLKKVTDLGVGIQNIKQRLALQYGNKASFTLEEANGKVIAKLIFKHEGI